MRPLSATRPLIAVLLMPLAAPLAACALGDVPEVQAGPRAATSSATPTSTTTTTTSATPTPTPTLAAAAGAGVGAGGGVSVPRATAAPKGSSATSKSRATAAPRTSGGSEGSAYYANCDAVRAAGAAPIYRGQPGYRLALDRDNDGIGCEVTTVRATSTRTMAPTSTPRPTTTTTTTAAAPTTTPSSSGVFYANCDEARQAGAAPILEGQAGYRAALDRDGDGIACET